MHLEALGDHDRSIRDVFESVKYFDGPHKVLGLLGVLLNELEDAIASNDISFVY